MVNQTQSNEDQSQEIAMKSANAIRKDDLSIHVFRISDGVETNYADRLYLFDTIKNPTLFQSPLYCWCYAATFGADRAHDRIVVISQEGRTVAIIPLRLAYKTLLGPTVRVLKFVDTPIPLPGAILSPEFFLSDALNALQQHSSTHHGLRRDVVSSYEKGE